MPILLPHIVFKGLFGIPVLSDWQASRRRQSLVPLAGSQLSGSGSVSTICGSIFSDRRIVRETSKTIFSGIVFRHHYILEKA